MYIYTDTKACIYITLIVCMIFFFFFYIKQKNIIGTYFPLNTKRVFEVILISQPTAVRVVGVLLAYSVR